MKILVVTIKSWNIERAKKFVLITDKKDLTLENVKRINPRYIFFIHWSWKIPEEIYKNFNCIGFHMTDLPYGRGGSPLQNLIIRNIKNTKISAIKIVNEIDSGRVYLKRNLSLDGTAKEIFERFAKIVFNDMIPYILKNNPVPIKQQGQIVMFERRKPEQSNISQLKNLDIIYNYIRMVDGEGYPPAFIRTENLIFEFTNAKYKKGYIKTDVKIRIVK